MIDWYTVRTWLGVLGLILLGMAISAACALMVWLGFQS